MDKKNLEKIKEISTAFFAKMDIGAEVRVGKPEDSTIPVDLKMDEPQTLIGEGGQTLAEIQYLLRIVLRKQVVLDQPFYVNLDINDYKRKKAAYLKEIAKDMADEASLTKKEKQLLPMSAYERRIVHMELASREDVVTESIGEGQDRRVVIRSRP